MALTKAELAEALFEELGLNKREAKEFVDYFFEEVRERLEPVSYTHLTLPTICSV